LNDAGDLVFIDAAGNEIPSTGNKVSTNQGNTLNYDCKKLYEAWTAALNMINSFGTDNDINTMDAFNDDQGANTSEDHYDNKESRDEQKFNVLNFIISYKMRKFQNGEGKATKARQQSEANFPNLFMQAAGYQFAVILDELETMPTEYSSAGVALPLNNELPPTISTSYLSSNHGTYAPLLKDDSGVIETPSRLIYPYILRPEWMFKYFVYNLKDNPGFKDNPSAPEPDWSWLIPDHRELEIQTCYKPPCTNTPICFNDCRYFHESWSSGQRLNFYYMIKGAAVNPDSRVDPNDQNMFSNQTCPTGPDLLAKAEEQLAAYTASLESRSAEIRGQIVQMLLNSCYTIEDCASPGACQISNKMVDQMTAKTIQVCKDGVLKEVHDHVTSNAGGYPKCTKQDCYWPDNSGICQIKTQMIIEYFQPCDQLLLNQLSSWNFLPYMPKCPSANCTPPTPPPAGQPCSTTSQNSKAYQVSN
ncbi:MAG: hypothetical protein ABIQ93_07605, partial [Saprospiraceae bacterium]